MIHCIFIYASKFSRTHSLPQYFYLASTNLDHSNGVCVQNKSISFSQELQIEILRKVYTKVYEYNFYNTIKLIDKAQSTRQKGENEQQDVLRLILISSTSSVQILFRGIISMHVLNERINKYQHQLLNRFDEHNKYKNNIIAFFIT